MRDPEVVLEIDREQKTAQSVSFENSYLGIFQQVHQENEQGTVYTNHALQKNLNAFVTSWLCNLKQQGFYPSKETA
jgi:hypothetical protein